MIPFMHTHPRNPLHTHTTTQQQPTRLPTHMLITKSSSTQAHEHELFTTSSLPQALCHKLI
jgi:hypothetical protein